MLRCVVLLYAEVCCIAMTRGGGCQLRPVPGKVVLRRGGAHVTVAQRHACCCTGMRTQSTGFPVTASEQDCRGGSGTGAAVPSAQSDCAAGCAQLQVDAHTTLCCKLGTRGPSGCPGTEVVRPEAAAHLAPSSDRSLHGHRHVLRDAGHRLPSLDVEALGQEVNHLQARAAASQSPAGAGSSKSITCGRGQQQVNHLRARAAGWSAAPCTSAHDTEYATAGSCLNSSVEARQGHGTPAQRTCTALSTLLHHTTPILLHNAAPIAWLYNTSTTSTSCAGMIHTQALQPCSPAAHSRLRILQQAADPSQNTCTAQARQPPT
jgi:hypothetical protein